MSNDWTKIPTLNEFEDGQPIFAEDFNENFDDIKTKHNAFVDEVDEAIEDLDEADTALGTRLTTAEGNITSLGTRMTTAEGTITSHGTTLTTHGTTLGSHASRLTTAESDIDTLETSVESTQEDVEDLEDAIDTVEARVDAVEDDIETLETLVAANTTAITNEATRAGGVEAGLNTRLGTAESTITSHTSTLTGHTNTLGQHTNSINNHNNRITVAEGNISTLNTNKQNKLTAGENITITNNVISAIDTNSVFKMNSDTPIADIQAAQAEGKVILLLNSSGSTYLLTFENTVYYYFTSFHSGGSAGVRVYTAQLKKSDHTWTSSSFMLQNQLTAGTGITISNNVISATGGESNLLIGKPPSDPSDPQPGELTYVQVAEAIQAGKLVIMIDPFTGTELYTYGGFWNFNHLFYYTWHDGTSTYTQRGLFNEDNEWTVGESNILMNENAANKAYSITSSEFDEDDAYPNLKAVKDYAEPKHQDFRLLNEITLNGEESITLTADANGTPYNLKEMMIVGIGVTPTDTTVASTLKMYAYNNSMIIGGLYAGSWKTNRYMRSYIKYEGGFYRTENQVANSTGNWNAALTSETSSGWLAFDTTKRIEKVIISSNSEGIQMASGTIKIYGR